MIVMSEMYVVVRYYTEAGFVACADFYQLDDAREYFLWQKKRNPGQIFEWRLYRREYTDDGIVHTLLEG